MNVTVAQCSKHFDELMSLLWPDYIIWVVVPFVPIQYHLSDVRNRTHASQGLIPFVMLSRGLKGLALTVTLFSSPLVYDSLTARHIMFHQT